MRISVVIPCFKSPKTLERLIDDIDKTLAEINVVNTFEIVLVLDSSDAQIWQRIKKITQLNNRVTGLRLSRNFGQHQAIGAGITHARYEYILTLDDDSQHPPTEISKFIDSMSHEVDLVYGHATLEEHSFLRNLSSRSSKIIFKYLLGIRYAKDFSAYRFFRKSVCSIEELQHEMGTSLDIYLTERTNHILCIPVNMAKRAEGKSNYSLRKLFKYAFGIIVSSSRVPLKFMTLIGISGAAIAGGTSLLILLRWLFWGISIPGYTSLFLMIGFLTSINCMSLGILGEYLGSVHKKVSRQPMFIVRDVINDGKM